MGASSPRSPRRAVRACISIVLAALMLLVAACTDERTRLQAEARALEARDWNHLAGLPDAKSVIARVSGSSPLQAIARQCQALTHLHGLLDDPMFTPKALGPLPPAGRQRADEYAKAIDGELYARFRDTGRRAGTSQGEWRKACKGQGAAWQFEKLKAADWTALLAPPARELAARQVAWFEASTSTYTDAVQTARERKILAERVTVSGIGLLVTLLGLYMLRRGWRVQRELDRYEFEHRTDGGVVQFEAYEDAVRHHRRRVVAMKFLYPFGVLITLIGLVALFARMFG